MWYSQNKKELEKELDRFLSPKLNIKGEIHGLIVPHAGYEFSGEIAGKAFSFLKNKNHQRVFMNPATQQELKEEKKEKAVIIAPSHHTTLKGILTSNKKEWYTSLGKINLFNEEFDEGEIEREHAIDNQIPFLQQLGFREILPLMVGQITDEQAKKIAEKLSKIQAFFIFSTDLSHFLPYNQAITKDKETIRIIENQEFQNFNRIDACGFFPLLIFFHLCKINGWKPRLIEYKNSGDVTGEKSSVVGYASFYF